MSSDRIQHAGSPMVVPPGLPAPGGDDVVNRPPSPRQRASTAPDGLRNLRSASQSPALALRGLVAPRNPAPTVKPAQAGSSSSSAATPADADPRLAFNQALKQVAHHPIAQRQLAVVQRVLTGGNLEAFNEWFAAQPLKIGDQQRAEIIRESDTLEEAQQMSLDAEAGTRIVVKRKVYEKLHTSRRDKVGKAKTEGEKARCEQAALSIEAAIAELDDAQEHGGLGKGVASAVVSMAQLLLKTHPPETCTYVLMGNSPAPLLAWLILNGHEKAACHLPLGGLTTPRGEELTAKIVEEDPLPEPITRYFNQSLAAVVARNLPIVLIDYVSTGGSLVKTADYIERWLNGKGLGLPVSFFGYTEHTLPEAVALAESPYAGTMATAKGLAEKVFTKLNADKVVKDVLLIKGPATLDVADLLEGKAPTAQPAYWKRVLRLMRAALLRED